MREMDSETEFGSSGAEGSCLGLQILDCRFDDLDRTLQIASCKQEQIPVATLVGSQIADR
jgi:hypothetical protein